MPDSEDYLKKIIYYFLALNRVRPDETKNFTSLKHNKDLCPGLNNKIEIILGFFERYRKISYDTQGIKDEGSDVILRYYISEKAKYICFQIKSQQDLKDKDYLRKIKAQYVDSENKYNFEDYYIIIATDETKDINKIRSIKANFSSMTNVTIIDPSQFLFLLTLKEPQMGAIIKSFANEGDLMLQKALDLVKGLLRPQYILVFYIIDISIRKGFSSELDIDYIQDSSYLKNIYESYAKEESYDEQGDNDDDEDEDYDPFDSRSYKSNEFNEMLEEDFNYMDEQFFTIDYENKKMQPEYNYLKPIIGLTLEAQLKYEFDNEETVDYLEQLIFGF